MYWFQSVMEVGHERGKKATGNEVEVLVNEGEVSDLVDVRQQCPGQSGTFLHIGLVHMGDFIADHDCCYRWYRGQ